MFLKTVFSETTRPLALDRNRGFPNLSCREIAESLIEPSGATEFQLFVFGEDHGQSGRNRITSYLPTAHPLSSQHVSNKNAIENSCRSRS
jgi:hypothetical protein